MSVYNEETTNWPRTYGDLTPCYVVGDVVPGGVVPCHLHETQEGAEDRVNHPPYSDPQCCPPAVLECQNPPPRNERIKWKEIDRRHDITVLVGGPSKQTYQYQQSRQSS